MARLEACTLCEMHILAKLLNALKYMDLTSVEEFLHLLKQGHQYRISDEFLGLRRVLILLALKCRDNGLKVVDLPVRLFSDFDVFMLLQTDGIEQGGWVRNVLACRGVFAAVQACLIEKEYVYEVTILFLRAFELLAQSQ